jgi:hypothetical protein
LILRSSPANVKIRSVVLRHTGSATTYMGFVLP